MQRTRLLDDMTEFIDVAINSSCQQYTTNTCRLMCLCLDISLLGVTGHYSTLRLQCLSLV